MKIIYTRKESPVPKYFTPGKVYNVVSVSVLNSVYIVADNGRLCCIPDSMMRESTFVDLERYRESQINKILEE
jgi:hypothetical protein